MAVMCATRDLHAQVADHAMRCMDAGISSRCRPLCPNHGRRFSRTIDQPRTRAGLDDKNGSGGAASVALRQQCYKNVDPADATACAVGVR